MTDLPVPSEQEEKTLTPELEQAIEEAAELVAFHGRLEDCACGEFGTGSKCRRHIDAAASVSILRDLVRKALGTVEADRVCPGCELRLMKADTSDGTLRMSLSDPTGAAQVLAETFAGALDKAKAINYLEIIFLRPHDGQRYVVTVQRPEGKTPHEIRADLEFRLTAYRGDIAALESQLEASRQERRDDSLAALELGDKVLASREQARALAEAGQRHMTTHSCDRDYVCRDCDDLRAALSAYDASLKEKS